MTSAAEYRQYAQECIASAATTPDGPMRDQFLELAKLWTMAALFRENGNRSLIAIEPNLSESRSHA
jgi:hypothetical protein